MGVKSCAFLGQQPNLFSYGYNEDDFGCIRAKAVIGQYVQMLCSYGIRDFYTGCESGIETWGAETVISLRERFEGIRLFCVIPYAGQEKLWLEEQKPRYDRILEKSTQYIILERDKTSQAVEAKNNYLIDHTDMLISLYNPQKELTELLDKALKAAKEKRKGVMHIDPETSKVTPIMTNLAMAR